MSGGQMVVLGPGLDENGLALMVQGLLEEGLAADSAKRSLLAKMKGTICLHASDADVAVTLVFEAGRVTMSGGAVAAPALAVRAETERIAGMTLLRFWGLLPNLTDGAGRSFVAALASGKIRLRGAVLHPRLLLQFARLMSVN